MALVYWKYEINKLLQFWMVYKKFTLAVVYGSVNLTPWKMKFTPRLRTTDLDEDLLLVGWNVGVVFKKNYNNWAKDIY